MLGKAHRADSVFAGMSCSLDPGLLKFVNHYGRPEVNKFFSTRGDCTMDETRKAFQKMVRDFNSKPLKADEDEDEDVDRVQDLEDESEDKDVGEEDEADGKASKLFGDTKRAGLVKRLLAPIGDELEQKKPRVAEGSCVHGDKTEAAGIKDSSLQVKPWCGPMI